MNEKRHLFLYAKGWYEKTDTLTDLKKIVGKIALLDPEYVTERDILHFLFVCTEPYLSKDFQNRAVQFMTDVSTGYHLGLKMTPIEIALGVLSMTSCEELEDELGDPDPKILPLSNGGKKRLANKK
jgi:hypothetical protein